MTNRSKNLGTAAESAVVKYLRANGFPHAKRLTLSGRYDLGDVTLGDGWPVTIEVKAGHAAEGASDAQVAAWLEETERERLNARKLVGVLVLKRKGFSAANAGSWWVVMESWQYDNLRRRYYDGGYDSPQGVRYAGSWHAPVRFTLDHFVRVVIAANLRPLDSDNRSMENEGNPYSTLDGGEHGNGGSLLGESG